MGILIQHYKLTSLPNEKSVSFILDSWENNFTPEIINKYLTDVEDIIFAEHSLVFFDTIQDLNEYQKLFNDSSTKENRFVTNNEQEIQNTIKEFSLKYNYTDFEINDDFFSVNTIPYRGVFFTKPTYKKGFYANSVGNQSKAVENEFYEAITNSFLYCDYATFLLANTLVYEEWKESFKSDFVDNYEENCSFMEYG